MDQSWAIHLLKEAALYKHVGYDENGRMYHRVHASRNFPPTEDNPSNRDNAEYGIAIPIVNLKKRAIETVKNCSPISLRELIDQEVGAHCDEGRLHELIERKGWDRNNQVIDLNLDVARLSENMTGWIATGRMYGTDLSGELESGNPVAMGFEGQEEFNKTPLVKYVSYPVKDESGRPKGWTTRMTLGITHDDRVQNKDEHFGRIVYNIPVIATKERLSTPIGPYFFRFEFRSSDR